MAAFVSTGQEPVQVQHPLGVLGGSLRVPWGSDSTGSRALGTHHRHSVSFSDWSSGWELPASSSAFSCHKTFSLGVWMISASETFSQLSFSNCSNRLQKCVNVILGKMFVKG